MAKSRYAYWETRDGKKIEIKDLEDNHLINILRMFRRSGSRSGQRMRLLNAESLKRGLWLDPLDNKNSGSFSNDKFDDVCVECQLSLVCKTQRFVTRKCAACKRGYVAMGGSLGTMFVSGKCQRILLLMPNGYCFECGKKPKKIISKSL